MNVPKEEVNAILSQFNPWWRREQILDLPSWKRALFEELFSWITHPPAHRAIMLTGPRQVGKTTLLLQTIQKLLQEGVPAGNIVYFTFDHPMFKLVGLSAVLEAWRELEPKQEGPEYLFLDEAQCIPDFGTWVKHQVDFSKHRRIVFTGSATPLVHVDQESGVGRWHTIHISTLSFYEYLQIRNVVLPFIPEIASFKELFQYTAGDFLRVAETNQSLIGHFHEYLMHGGFPQTALMESVQQAQRLLREDIIDKILKRDMTALFGVRRVIELEQTFIFLCMHDGGLQDVKTLATNLGVNKATVQNFIHLLESAHLVYRLPPYGYGKEVLRARHKIYLADPAIASAILMKGKAILEDADALGTCVETAVFIHLANHSTYNHVHFSYWRSAKQKEVDLILEFPRFAIPFEVKYRSSITTPGEVPGLIEFSHAKTPECGYILTKSSKDIGPMPNKTATKLMRIPAATFCYFLGKAETLAKNLLS